MLSFGPLPSSLEKTICLPSGCQEGLAGAPMESLMQEAVLVLRSLTKISGLPMKAHDHGEVGAVRGESRAEAGAGRVGDAALPAGVEVEQVHHRKAAAVTR
jgi:hypothetical protein